MADVIPEDQKIYHIVHIDRLASVVSDGHLYCDSIMVKRQGNTGSVIGISAIKQRRMALPVQCHVEDTVGEYVPFYFCPRSIMLYVISRKNHPELAYRGGQESIVHLQADLRATLEWAENRKRRWAFTLSNAGAVYAKFRSRRADFSQVNWQAVNARDFRPADIRESKQSEFLLKETFPWELVERIGVHSMLIGQQATRSLQRAAHRPTVQVMPEWYY